MVRSHANTGCDALGFRLDSLIWLMQKRVWVIKWRYKAIWIQACYMHLQSVLSKKCGQFYPIFGQGSGHVFNLGHGIHQDVPESAPKIFVDAIHEFSKAYHK